MLDTLRESMNSSVGKTVSSLSVGSLLATAFAPSACAKEEGSHQEFKGKITRSYEESKEWWPEEVRPPEGAPNVIIFLLDDVGFAHVGSFGGLID
ncbi:MAG: hypothetical protein JSV50_06905, partial [Desulfobacteraceae bacterium]